MTVVIPTISHRSFSPNISKITTRPSWLATVGYPESKFFAKRAGASNIAIIVQWPQPIFSPTAAIPSSRATKLITPNQNTPSSDEPGNHAASVGNAGG